MTKQQFFLVILFFMSLTVEKISTQYTQYKLEELRLRGDCTQTISPQTGAEGDLPNGTK